MQKARKFARHFLSLLLAICLPVAASHAQPVGGGLLERRALQIAYRLDLELGETDAAQRHLLIWRISDALSGGEIAPGGTLSGQVLEWQRQIDSLEPPAEQGLPAWFAPQVPDTASALLLARAPSMEHASWHAAQRNRLASAAARLAAGPDSPSWSAAQQPQLLAWARDHGALIWIRFLSLLEQNPHWLPLVNPAISGWTALPLDAPLDQWLALKDAADAQLRTLRQPAPDPITDLVDGEVSGLLSEDMLMRRRDPLALRLAAYRLLSRDAAADSFERALIALARAIRGVEAGGFGELVQVLLGLAEISLIDPPAEQEIRLPAVLESLEKMDPVVLQMLESADLQLLTVYQQVRKLLRELADGSGPAPADGLRLLASLHAVHGVDSADLEGYLSQPSRARGNTDLLVCFDASRDRPPYPQEPITPNQFERCLEDFHDWAVTQAAGPELAGSAGGPFEADHLSRELELSPWQRINYWFGWLPARLGRECAAGDEPLVNPLEWAIAARAYASFAQRWPVYYLQNDRSQAIAELQAAGTEVLARIQNLRNCGRATQGPPMVLLMGEYENALNAAALAIGRESVRFRETHLKPGADVDLAAGAAQTTNYRPEKLLVKPCGGEPSCDMSDPLPPSRALLSLFPQPYLLADQIRLGQVSLCYANVRWAERRAQLPPVRNQAMARYFGRLGFELRGYFSGVEDPIFSMRLSSHDEYEYLFAENSAAVLEDPCPRRLIGTQVRSELPPRPLELVPRRLTFLTADRMHPAKVFQAHWAAGNEWRDRFVTGENVEILASNGPEPVLAAVDSRLSDLYRSWNKSVFNAMLDQRGGAGDSPNASMQDVDRHKQMVATFSKLLMPQELVLDSAMRAGVFGAGGLLDRNEVLRMQQQGVPVDQVAPLALSRYEDARFLFAGDRQRAGPGGGADRIVVGTLLQLAELSDRY